MLPETLWRTAGALFDDAVRDHDGVVIDAMTEILEEGTSKAMTFRQASATQNALRHLQATQRRRERALAWEDAVADHV